MSRWTLWVDHVILFMYNSLWGGGTWACQTYLQAILWSLGSVLASNQSHTHECIHACKHTYKFTHTCIFAYIHTYYTSLCLYKLRHEWVWFDIGRSSRIGGEVGVHSSPLSVWVSQTSTRSQWLWYHRHQKCKSSLLRFILFFDTIIICYGLL